jgi:Flp pilus assembly protein TadD
MKIFAEDPEVLNLLGSCYVEFRDFPKAKIYYDQSAQLARAQTESIVGKLQSAAELQQQLRDIPSSTEAQRTQPVRLENPPSLQGVLDKLDLLIKNAGVFS